MDLGWTLKKMEKTEDDFSTAEFLFSKPRSGPLFVFRETDSMFVLTSHLKGYKRENIKIEINQEGKHIVVSAEKPVQETVMVGNKVYKQEIEMKGFKKAFHFSHGLVLDKVKAKFNEREFVLTISIPKQERGFRGTRVEEVKQEEIGGTFESLQIEQNGDHEEIEKLNKGNVMDKEKWEIAEKGVEKREIVENVIEPTDLAQHVQGHNKTQTLPMEPSKGQVEENKRENGVKGDREDKRIIEPNKAHHIQELDETIKEVKEELEEAHEDESPKIRKKKKCKICSPMVVGSAILVSISVIIICLLRTQNQQRKKKN